MIQYSISKRIKGKKTFYDLIENKSKEAIFTSERKIDVLNKKAKLEIKRSKQRERW
jgi:hypothetical protein